MRQDENKTVVVFRKYKKKYSSGKYEIVALFPEISASSQNHCLSYEFCGQHGGADYYHVIHTMTTPSNPSEYAALKNHLEKDYGYNFKVQKRFTPRYK